MYGPSHKRIRAVKAGGLFRIQEDLAPETGPILRCDGAVMEKGSVFGVLVATLAPKCWGTVGPGPDIGPHSFELFSEGEGCYFVARRMVNNWLPRIVRRGASSRERKDDDKECALR